MAACCSINMRIFKITELMILVFLVVGTTSSVVPEKISNDDEIITKPIETSVAGDNYDQRQNGTENYRIHVDGLVVVVAPIEALLLAGGLPGSTDGNFFGVNQQSGIDDKPLRPIETEQSKPKPEIDDVIAKDKSLDSSGSHRPGLRIMNLLSPFLRRIHHNN